MLHEAMEYRFPINDILSCKVVIGRGPYAHAPILRHPIACVLRQGFVTLRRSKPLFSARHQLSYCDGKGRQVQLGANISRGEGVDLCDDEPENFGVDPISLLLAL